MKSWTTSRWKLDHRSVQFEIEPLRLKSHQALGLNLISCILPDFGSHIIYLMTTVIDNWTIYVSNKIVGEYRKKVELDCKGGKKMILHQNTIHCEK